MPLIAQQRRGGSGPGGDKLALSRGEECGGERSPGTPRGAGLRADSLPCVHICAADDPQMCGSRRHTTSASGIQHLQLVKGKGGVEKGGTRMVSRKGDGSLTKTDGSARGDWLKVADFEKWSSFKLLMTPGDVPAGSELWNH